MRNQDFKKLATFGAIAVAFFVIVILGITATKDKEVEDTELVEATPTEAPTLDSLYGGVSQLAYTPRKAPIELTTSSLADELPEINTNAMPVEGTGDINIEIFVSPEKSSVDNDKTKTDDWMLDVAKNFNNEGFQIDGKTISVSIRNVSSGLGADYIISGKYMPDAYSPSNSIWGSLITTQGGNVTLVQDKTVGNVAGIVISKSAKSKLEGKYSKADADAVIQGVVANEITLGYTNPLSSSTGLNFLLRTLTYYDSTNLLSDKAMAGFTSVQNNIPYVAYTTMQMRESALSGKLDAMVLEYQTYINTPALADYDFIPYGIRHDNPLYSVGNLSDDKKAVLDKFAEYCNNEDSQKLATSNGFNGFDSYKGESLDISGSTVLQAQKLWKDNKDSGKEIISVFVADCSGSMEGEPMSQLKQSLINGSQYISDQTYIGFVSYSDDVTINLPIAKFDLNQRSYFQGVVEDIQASGGTASYNGIVVAMRMIEDAKKDHPNAKVMLFLLSDGQQNKGYDLSEVQDVAKATKIPIYTISYGAEADKDAMASVSLINEAATINASVDDIVYKLKSLFNAQM